MKLKASVLSVLLCCLMFQINAQDRETKTHTVKDVKSIAVSGNVDIHIKQGSSKTVTIEASQNQHDKMEVEIKDNAISVACKGGKKNDKPVQVYVEVENLNAIAGSTGADIYFKNTIRAKKMNIALSSGSDLSGEIEVDKINIATSSGSDLNLKSLDANELQIALSGGSDMIAENVSVTKANLVISGGSDVDIAGTCDNMSLVASGGSDFMGNDFKVEKSSIIVSGASDANVHVSDEVSVVASGSSDIICKGKPNVKDKKISKGSDFIMK